MRPKKKRGRPATGHDAAIAVRLPAKLVRDIELWATPYRDEFEMDQSTAIRCLLLLGLQRPSLRAVDPKNKRTYEAATLPLLKFSRRARRWLDEGTGIMAQRKPPLPYKTNRRAKAPTKTEIDAIYERAVARSKRGR